MRLRLRNPIGAPHLGAEDDRAVGTLLGHPDLRAQNGGVGNAPRTALRPCWRPPQSFPPAARRVAHMTASFRQSGEERTARCRPYPVLMESRLRCWSALRQPAAHRPPHRERAQLSGQARSHLDERPGARRVELRRKVDDGQVETLLQAQLGARASTTSSSSCLRSLLRARRHGAFRCAGGGTPRRADCSVWANACEGGAHAQQARFELDSLVIVDVGVSR